MQRSEILNKIGKVLLEINPALTISQISEDTSLVNFDIDSLKLIELGLRLEKEFGDQVLLDEWIEQETQRENNAFSVSSLITFIQQAAN